MPSCQRLTESALHTEIPHETGTDHLLVAFVNVVASVPVELVAWIAVAAVGRVLVHAAPVLAAGIRRAAILLAANLQLAVELVAVGTLFISIRVVAPRVTVRSNAPSLDLTTSSVG